MPPLAECLPSVHIALSSVPSPSYTGHGGACLQSQHLRQRQREGVWGDPWPVRRYLKITKRHPCLGLALSLFPVAAITNCHKLYLTVPAVRDLVKKACASSSGKNPASKIERDRGAHPVLSFNLQTLRTHTYTHRCVCSHKHTRPGMLVQTCDPNTWEVEVGTSGV